MYLDVQLPIADPGDVQVAGAALGGAALLRKRPRPARDVAEREGSVVLLAEDHPINRRVLVHQLAIIGFQVDTAEDGQKAFELFARGRYGLVLTDLNMPVMDGFELARAIRRREAETGMSPTPIVALSANVMPEEAERCSAAGMDDFAGKPTSMPVLADKLCRWMPHIDWPDSAGPGPVGPPAAGVRVSEHHGVVDRAVLDELTGGDAELADAILADYVESSSSDLAALRAALADEDADRVRRLAHRMKGAGQTVGAHEVASLAAELEAVASTTVEDWHGLRATAEDLELAIVRVAAAVDSPAVMG